MRRLITERNEFVLLLDRVKLRKLTAARIDASLTYKDGFACLEYGSTRHVFHARGEWAGEARFSASVIYALKHYPPNDEIVSIAFVDGFLSVGPLKVSASWSAMVCDAPPIPDDADWVTALVLSARERGDKTRFLPAVKAAEVELAARIARAAGELAPLGITQADLRALVQVRLVERA